MNRLSVVVLVVAALYLIGVASVFAASSVIVHLTDADQLIPQSQTVVILHGWIENTGPSSVYGVGGSILSYNDISAPVDNWPPLGGCDQFSEYPAKATFAAGDTIGSPDSPIALFRLEWKAPPVAPLRYNAQIGINYELNPPLPGEIHEVRIAIAPFTITVVPVPTVTINQASGQAGLTSGSSINFTVVFSAPVTDFATGDVTLSGTAGATTATVTGGGTTYNVAVSGMTTSGTVIANLATGVAHDAVGNPNSSSTSTDNTVTFDNLPPNVTISKASGQADPTAGSSVNFTAVFSESVSGFTTSDVTLGGTSGATTVIVTGSGTTYSVKVSGMTTTGTVIPTIAAGVAHDAAGNGNAASTSTDSTVLYDTEGPTVTIAKAFEQADPTNGSSINFTVVFSESVSNFATGDVTLGGTAGATTATVTGSGTTYNVAVSGMATSGTVVATVGSDVASDAVGHPSFASTSTDNTVTFDIVAPTVTINQAVGQADLTNASPINFTVVFSEPVSDFATGDVTLGGTSGATAATVTGSGTTYNVAVSGMPHSGTVVATIASAIAHDAAGNPNSVSSSTDSTVTYDSATPTVTINKASDQADPTNGSPINFAVVFSEPVSDFATGDVTLSGTANATTAIVTGSGTTYNVAVSGMTHTGSVVATIASAIAHDPSGNGNSASTSTDSSVTYDNAGPTVTINKAAGQADPTNGSSINFTVVFGESVSDFATGDVALSGTAGATTATVTGSGTTYNVAVSGMTTTGTVIAAIVAGVAHDAAGNGSIASTSTDNSVSYDTEEPTVTINKASGQADPTNGSPINFRVVFSESVSDFATGDVALSGTAGATTAVVTGSGTTFNVAVSGMAISGNVIATIASGVAHDAAGNENDASTSTDNTVTYDNEGPTVTIDKASGQADPTNDSTVNFTVVFSESVSDFATGDVTLAGTAGATTATVTGSDTTYNVAVSGMTSSGTIIATVAADVASDGAGHPSAASTSAENTVTYDVDAPTCVVTGPASPTNVSPLDFTITFSEVVSGLASTDVSVTGGTKGALSGGGSTYHILVTPSGDGHVTLVVPVGSSVDSAGNLSVVSNTADVLYDSSAPTCTVTGPSSPASTSPVAFTITFSEPVTGLTADSVVVTGGVKGALTGAGASYTIPVTPTGDGIVTCQVPADSAADAAGNGNSASAVCSLTYVTAAPTVVITSPTTAASLSRNCPTLDIAGTATAGAGLSSLTWSSNRGGSGDCTIGGAWTGGPISLLAGANVITVTATDTVSRSATAVLTVTYVDTQPGTAWSGIAMVSLPIIPDTTDPNAVVGFDRSGWYAYDTAAVSYIPYSDHRSWFEPQSATPGRGFWAYFPAGGGASPCGTIPPQDVEAKIRLQPGWNLIGTPFINAVPWNTVQVKVGDTTTSLVDAAGSVDSWCWGWDNVGNEYYLVYDTSIVPTAHGSLEPWLGYWIKAYAVCDLVMPAP